MICTVPYHTNLLDGPALRATALITYANWLVKNSNSTFVKSKVWPVLKLDLDYTATFWNASAYVCILYYIGIFIKPFFPLASISGRRFPLVLSSHRPPNIVLFERVLRLQQKLARSLLLLSTQSRLTTFCASYKSVHIPSQFDMVFDLFMMALRPIGTRLLVSSPLTPGVDDRG